MNLKLDESLDRLHAIMSTTINISPSCHLFFHFIFYPRPSKMGCFMDQSLQNMAVVLVTGPTLSNAGEDAWGSCVWRSQCSCFMVSTYKRKEAENSILKQFDLWSLFCYGTLLPWKQISFTGTSHLCCDLLSRRRFRKASWWDGQESISGKQTQSTDTSARSFV